MGLSLIHEDDTPADRAEAETVREYTDDGRRIVQPGDLHRLSNRDERSSHDVWPAMPRPVRSLR